MGKYKAHPKYNVLSIRVTDEERAFMNEIQRHTQKVSLGLCEKRCLITSRIWKFP